jgi:hypothetical protein
LDGGGDELLLQQRTGGNRGCRHAGINLRTQVRTCEAAMKEEEKRCVK